MIKVLFFAQLREQLGCANVEVEWQTDLDTLQSALGKRDGGRWQALLEQPNIVRSVNQVAVYGNTELRDGDEVAFYPPVTGG